MTTDPRPTTSGYAREAPELLDRYEAYDPVVIYTWLRRYLPGPPADALDIGAGTGRDAAWLAGLGYRVTAVEPVRELREGARRLHPDPGITWVDDHLPALEGIPDASADLVLLGAVWMHFDEDQRAAGMATLARLARPGAILAMTVRHGPVPPGRRMFEIDDGTIVENARRHGFVALNLGDDPGARGTVRPGIRFARFAFRWEGYSASHSAASVA